MTQWPIFQQMGPFFKQFQRMPRIGSSKPRISSRFFRNLHQPNKTMTRDLRCMRSSIFNSVVWFVARYIATTWHWYEECNLGKPFFNHLLKVVEQTWSCIGRAPKGKDRIPTIHFQVLKMLVSGRVIPKVDKAMFVRKKPNSSISLLWE